MWSCSDKVKETCCFSLLQDLDTKKNKLTAQVCFKYQHYRYITYFYGD